MAIGQLAAVVLLFATLVFLRLDFNRFIYKVAFSFVAVGFLLAAMAPGLPQLGFVTLVAGFSYHRFGAVEFGRLPHEEHGASSPWVASCPGAALFSGVLVGGAVAYVVLGGRPYGEAAYPRQLPACFLFA